MSSFANMKRNTMDISKLVGAAEAASTKKESYSNTDERKWKPTVDKAGNGYAVIRFLPSIVEEEFPWARYWDHGFKGPTGKWYIEKSLTSIGQPDPLGELNSKLWNSGIESDKETARAQKRRLHYVSNIMVISDPSNPDTEGKVFLYEYGKKIFDKIMDVMQPQFPDEKPINPFHMWEGAEFVLKIRQVDGYRNYDKSEFKGSSALLDGDDVKLEAVFNTMHSLSEFTDPSEYKTYDELKAKLNEVLGERVEPKLKDTIATSASAPAPEYKTAEAVSESEEVGHTSTNKETDSEEDTLSYFAKLAQDS